MNWPCIDHAYSVGSVFRSVRSIFLAVVLDKPAYACTRVPAHVLTCMHISARERQHVYTHA
eukprot:11172947-Lingulodinium_polyedra.AAC.1